ncbi:hypothetical protein, partial [Atlantibacter hermannii]|uniref:hypothetical protein n=1 Tax=Atlantibacter hermannii TaxID=565 RepID=UPI002FD8F3AF
MAAIIHSFVRTLKTGIIASFQGIAITRYAAAGKFLRSGSGANQYNALPLLSFTLVFHAARICS